MRLRFAPAALAVVLAASAAPAFDREPLQPGDSALGDILVPHTLDEYTIRLAYGSNLTMTIVKSGGGSIQPALGLFDDNYGGGSVIGQGVPLIALGATTLRNRSLLGSGQYRIIVVGRGAGVGGYRVTTSVKPMLRFASAGAGANPAPKFSFGAYPGFEATVALRWKGPAPVTITSMTGPDGAAVTSVEAPVLLKSTSSVQSGFHASVVGDHLVQLDVPAGTVRWSAVVKLTGRFPRGVAHDFRTTGLPEAPTLRFPSTGPGGRIPFPLVVVEGEDGGPNDCLLSSDGGQPNAAFLESSGDCHRSALGTANPPDTYLVYCLDGYFADVRNLVRYADGPWKGLVASFDAPSVRTPKGSGGASLSGFAYDGNLRPTGWTEIRRFDDSGRTYTLEISGAEYFQGSGSCKAYRVRHVESGRKYDFAPFR